MMNKIKTADAIIEGLENSGIKYIFGVPGEENLDVLEAIRKSKIIKFILTRHEQEAGFMAATIGRLTGIPGVALSTLGPGATNLVTAAAYAQLGGMPLLMLTGQKPIRESKQGAFQIIDVVDMMKPITKFSKQLVEGSFAFSYVREAIRLCTEERPGAVLLEIPEDIAAENIDYKPIPISEVRRPIAAETSINKIVELLVKAKRPLVVVGAGANRKRTSNMLTDLITKFNIPFVNTQMGKGASEIYTKGLEKVDAILSQDQKDLTTKLVGATQIGLITTLSICPGGYIPAAKLLVHTNTSLFTVFEY